MYPESRLSYNWIMKKTINDRARDCFSHLSGVVIDFGCGARPFETDILAHAEAYFGIDWSNTPHDLKADLVADLNRPLPIQSESADHVVSLEVLEHLAEPDVMLGEAYRTLKPGGRLVLSMPFQWWLHEAPWDYQRFTRYGLEYHLRKAGFDAIDIQPHGGFWTTWLLKLNYQTARTIRGPRWMRRLIRTFWLPLWYLDQTVAPLLDKLWPDERETAGYFVISVKPAACGSDHRIDGDEEVVCIRNGDQH